jgi:hypothetical protein
MPDAVAEYMTVVRLTTQVATLEDLLAVARDAHPESVRLTLPGDDGFSYLVDLYFVGKA